MSAIMKHYRQQTKLTAYRNYDNYIGSGDANGLQNRAEFREPHSHVCLIYDKEDCNAGGRNDLSSNDTGVTGYPWRNKE